MGDPPRPHDRLQPALLDRLIDDEPARRRDLGGVRALTRSQLRQAVLRDLAWLLNATRLESAGSSTASRIDMTTVPHARKSVVNFGLPALSGKLASAQDGGALEKAIRTAILDFEPRILPESLSVSALIETDSLDHHNVIGVEIMGQLWAQPVPMQLLLRTEIDLETGEVKVAELGSARA